jgi:hypothetical protein
VGRVVIWSAGGLLPLLRFQPAEKIIRIPKPEFHSFTDSIPA